MFSRRHPYLFFLLTFTLITCVSSILIAYFTGPGSGKSEFDFGDKVGIIEVIDVIAESGRTLDDLKRFREDDSIKAIVLRIDSPGGGVGPSQEIFQEVMKTRKIKKVVVSMGSVAASGGYYIAAAGDVIFANPGTITGSIGVIMSFTNFQELFSKIGLKPVVIKSGKYKDIGSATRPLTGKERKLLEDFAADIHEQFIGDIANGRNMDIEKVRASADGRIFSGREGKENGLIDELGNLHDAIDKAGKLGGIIGEVNVVYARVEKTTLLDYLTQTSFFKKFLTSLLEDQAVKADLVYSPEQ